MAQPLPSTGYCPGFTGTMGVSDFLSGVWLPCFLHLSAILPVGRPDRISTVPPLSCVSSPVLRPRPLLSSSIVQMTAVACSVSDRIGKENLYFGAESAGSLTPLTTLSPDVTASDPSLGNSADAAYCVGLTPTEQRELQSSWALTTRAALRRCAPSARTRKKAGAHRKDPADRHLSPPLPICFLCAPGLSGTYFYHLLPGPVFFLVFTRRKMLPPAAKTARIQAQTGTFLMLKQRTLIHIWLMDSETEASK